MKSDVKINSKVDILGGEWTPCQTCGDPFGTHIAVDSGILQEAICFSCIVELTTPCIRCGYTYCGCWR